MIFGDTQRQAIHVRSIKLSTSDKEKWIDMSNINDYLITRMVHMIKKNNSNLLFLKNFVYKERVLFFYLIIMFHYYILSS